MNNLVIVIINFQTPDLLSKTIQSFIKFYPQIPLVIIDNGSQDSSKQIIQQCQKQYSQITVISFSENIFHGPAMHYAMKNLSYDYLFFLDSDTEVKQEGFLEKMVEMLSANEYNYGIGKKSIVDKRGFHAKQGTPILLSYAMVIKKELYQKFPPFRHHGLPVLKNFTSAQQQGYKLLDFPVEEYIFHKGRGTAERFGYKLGWKSKVDYVLHKIGL